ncbi:MAG: cobalamin-binding protein [Woeseiaceae bacterium]|nr:cobalamin-binding protein [Woeseiaceae bacterium]
MISRRALALALAMPALAACAPEAGPAADGAAYERVVSLAPGLTELVFAAGAGDTLVGVSAYSDYPPPARELPVVGDAFTVDRERLALLEPDALFVWESGTPAHVVQELEAAGFTVEVLRTRQLADIAAALRRIGTLTGREAAAAAAADAFRARLARLEAEHAGLAPVSVFYQVARRPLYTINGEHYVSELIGLCGGRNVFADLAQLAPTVDVEAVVARDPEAMLASDEAGTEAFTEWQRWPALAANRYGNHFLVPADEIGRATPRVAAAAAVICAALETARARRAAAAGRADGSPSQDRLRSQSTSLPDSARASTRAQTKSRSDSRFR